MAAKSTITFGIISIPVKLQVCAVEDTFGFNLISPNGNRIKQVCRDAVTDEEVERSQCRKGAQIDDNNLVVFSEDEIEALSVKANCIEIVEFVNTTDFDPVQIQKSYFMMPEKGAEKSYKTLLRGMQSASKLAVVKYYARGKDHLGLLSTDNDRLTMFLVYYINEIRAFNYQFSDATEPSEKELKLAEKLISKLSVRKLDLSKHTDEFSARVRAAIQAKTANISTSLAEEKSKTNVGVDLIAALEQSLEEVAISK